MNDLMLFCLAIKRFDEQCRISNPLIPDPATSAVHCKAGDHQLLGGPRGPGRRSTLLYPGFLCVSEVIHNGSKSPRNPENVARDDHIVTALLNTFLIFHKLWPVHSVEKGLSDSL